MAVRMDLASIFVGVWSVDRAVKAEANDGVVVFSDIAFCTLFARILDDADDELALDPLKPSKSIGGDGGGGIVVDILS